MRSKGIEINNSSGNHIGGSTAADRNVIAGNNDDGIILLGRGQHPQCDPGQLHRGRRDGKHRLLATGADGIVSAVGQTTTPSVAIERPVKAM